MAPRAGGMLHTSAPVSRRTPESQPTSSPPGIEHPRGEVLEKALASERPGLDGLRTSAGEVLGSDFDAHHEASRRPARRPWRRVKQALSYYAVGLIAGLWPRLYEWYCRLVWRTSTVNDELTSALEGAARRHGRVVCLLWHQEVFTVAWAYRTLHAHTLASTGNFGRVITRMLERCNFTVFRGGSSTGTSRRRRLLPAMIQHMHECPTAVIYGITVDGSNGPAWVMKPGGPLIARACRAPVYVVRLSASRAIELPTWDRTAIPLPFGRLTMRAVGPYWIDPAAEEPTIERFSSHVESELLDLTHALGRDLDPAAPAPLGFPAGWTARWPKGAASSPGLSGLALGPHDLRPWDPPAWASTPGPQHLTSEEIDEEYAT